MSLVDELHGVTSCSRYKDGTMNECTVSERNELETSVGVLVPRYTNPDFRSKDLKSLSFFPDGSLCSVCLDTQTTIETPLGPFPAELVTFYQDGSLNSVFPLNGQMSFGWSEEEEGALAGIHDFELPFENLSVKLNGLRFYPDGRLKIIMFWPGETVQISTPLGVYPGRIGIRMYESGALRSFEPAIPIPIDTPIGDMTAFDPCAIGVDADMNSVRFDEDGHLMQFSMAGDLVVKSATRGRKVISSRTKPGFTDDAVIRLPLVVGFEKGRVGVDDGVELSTFDIADCQFLALPDFDLSGFACAGECGGCDICA